MNTREIDLEMLSTVLDEFEEFDQITQIIIQKWMFAMLDAPENAKRMKGWSYIRACEYFCNVWMKDASEHVKSILQDFLDEARDLDKVINREDYEGQRGQAGILPRELNTPKALEYFEKAKAFGLIDNEYKWQKTKSLLACFCYDMGQALKLSKGNRARWKPFEELFGCKIGELRFMLRDIRLKGCDPKGCELVQKVFRG